MASSAAEPADTVDADRSRREFLALVADIRPALHRYCARMTGSITDGEDVVQDTLARAYDELALMPEPPPLRPWLFRIAHNRAIDHWRRETGRAAEPLDSIDDIADDALREPDNLLARDQAVRAAIACFLMLAPAQRGCVILKDVLEHTLDEIAAELDLSVPAVKAALHRGRLALQRSTAAARPAPPPPPSPALQRYARLFNAHDWDGVRALLADDVRLDLVSQRKAAGRRDVQVYFTNYERLRGWRVVPASLDGREVLLVSNAAATGATVYCVELGWRDGLVTAIRDYRYVPYIAQDWPASAPQQGGAA